MLPYFIFLGVMWCETSIHIKQVALLTLEVVFFCT